MDPAAAGREAVLAAGDVFGQVENPDLVEMGAVHRGTCSSRWDASPFVAARCAWTNCTTIAPSPTAVAQRFVEPARTSPAAKTPGTLVARRCSPPASSPVRMKPL